MTDLKATLDEYCDRPGTSDDRSDGLVEMLDLLWPVIEAAKRMAHKYEQYDSEYIPSVRDVLEAEENFEKCWAELKEKLQCKKG